MKSSPKSGRRITASDIAARAGVSIGAVSFALNGRDGVSEATRARVVAIAQEMGWAPASAARSLAGAATETFGLVLTRDPAALGIETFFMRFIAGVESVLAPRSYGLLLQVVPSAEEEMATLRKWRASRRVDGVLIVDIAVDDPRIELVTGTAALPAVIVGDARLAKGLTSVSTDDAVAMRAAVRRLAELGHRRVAHVSGMELLAHTQVRDTAFREESQRLGLDVDVLRTDYAIESGARMTRVALEKASRPTAIIYDNDVMAVAGLGVAMGMGLRVPRDVSIIAWDDSVLCEHTFPPLAALSRDVVGLGAHVARRLFAVVEGAEPAAYWDATPVLVERGSLGPAAL